jgi:hypothetical protein
VWLGWLNDRRLDDDWLRLVVEDGWMVELRCFFGGLKQ